MHIVSVGLSHKTAPVEIREKLTFPENVQKEALQKLLEFEHVAEGVILSTCNRTEIYCVVSEPDKGCSDIIVFLCEYHGLDRKELEKYLYFKKDEDTIYHLFNVSASLDSMVVGEAQILGQVKDAYQYGHEAGATGIIFNRLFRHGIEVGKRVRTDTEIGESAVSISYAAVQLAKSVFENLEGRSVMIIGAGKMSELTAKHLLSNGVTRVYVANRTYERGQELAKKFNGEAIRYEELTDYMVKTDIVISSTGASTFILNKDDIAGVMQKRKNKPIFFIDIAVPRDINPEAGKLYNVFLYDIDDLENVVKANMDERIKEAGKAKEIIDREAGEFIAWLSTLEVVPTIKALREKIETIKEGELERHLGRLQHLSDRDLEVIKSLASGIINKVLHEPTAKLRECADNKDGYLYIESMRHIFDLEEEEEEEKK